jgi:hypothetical protein
MNADHRTGQGRGEAATEVTRVVVAGENDGSDARPDVRLVEIGGDGTSRSGGFFVAEKGNGVTRLFVGELAAFEETDELGKLGGVGVAFDGDKDAADGSDAVAFASPFNRGQGDEKETGRDGREGCLLADAGGEKGLAALRFANASGGWE